MKQVIAVLSLLWACSSGAFAAPSASTEEQRAWLAASAADDPTAYMEFVKEFPDGTFAPLARIRLNETTTPAHDVALTGARVDLAPLDQRHVQRRTIEPRSKPSCLSSPDAACLLFEITALIATRSDATDRVYDLSSLGRTMAKAGDLAGALKYLQQAASVARGLSEAERKADYLSEVGEAAAITGNIQVANDLLKEALASAKAVAAGKTDDSSLRDRGYALVKVAVRFAIIGKTEEATRVFAEAKNLATRLKDTYRTWLLKDIARGEAESGLLQDALLTISELLSIVNDRPQMNALGGIEGLGRYSDIKEASELLASIGQDTGAIALARSVGHSGIRVDALLRVRDELHDIGAHDLGDLDNSICEAAREAAKTKDAWIYASDIGCALARFVSVKEGVSTARNLFAQARNVFAQARQDQGYHSQQYFAQCLARNIGPDEAVDFLAATRLPSDSKASREYNSAVEEIARAIARAFARRGNLEAAKEWINKLPEDDRSFEHNMAVWYFEEKKRKHIAALTFDRQFKQAIAEAQRLQRQPESTLHWIVKTAVHAKDLNSALEAARLISDDDRKVSVYTSLLELM